MNLLVVHEVSYANKVIYEYQEFAERLAARGHRVTVIDFDEASDGMYREQVLSRTGSGAVTLRNTPFVNAPLIKYVSGRMNYSRLLAKTIDDGRVDVAFVYSVFINGTTTIRMCRRRKIPVVYRVLDAYHKLRQNHWTEFPLFLGERFIYRNADVVSLTNPKMQSYVDRVASEPCEGRSAILEHGVDTLAFKPQPRNEALARANGIGPDDRVALFVGSLYPFAGVDVVLRHFETLRDACPQAKIVVVGDGPLMPDLRRIVAERKITERVLFTGMRPYDEVPQWLSLARVAFNPFHLNDVTRDIIPIKMLQYLASGTAVLSAPIPDVMRAFPEYEGAIYCDIADGERYARTLGSLLADDETCRRLGLAGRKLILRERSLDRTIERLERLLTSRLG